MRCPDCNRFVSFDEPEVEILAEQVEDGEYTVEARIVLVCAECSTELKEANLENTEYFQHDCAGHPEDEEPSEEDVATPEFEIDDEADIETYERQDKKIHVYGANLTAHIHCPVCEQTFDIESMVEAPSNEFDEMV